jgi:hypothetical protein
MNKKMNIGIQFHALPEELLSFVSDQVKEFSLHIATVRHFPYEVLEVGREALSAAFADPSVYSLMFTVDSPKLPASGTNDLLQRNPDALLLDIGRRSEKGLRESSMMTRAFAPHATTIWTKIVRRFKTMTRAGATAINPATGATGRARDQRYTEGARALNLEGVAMLPVAGTAILRLG